MRRRERKASLPRSNVETVEKPMIMKSQEFARPDKRQTLSRPKRDTTPLVVSSKDSRDASVGRSYQTKLRPSSPMNNLITKLVRESMSDIHSKVRLDSNSRKSAHSGLDVRAAAETSQPNTGTLRHEEVKEGSEVSSVAEVRERKAPARRRR